MSDSEDARIAGMETLYAGRYLGDIAVATLLEGRSLALAELDGDRMTVDLLNRMGSVTDRLVFLRNPSAFHEDAEWAFEKVWRLSDSPRPPRAAERRP